MCSSKRCPYINVRCCACSAGWIGLLFGLIGLITVCVLVGKFNPPTRDEIPSNLFEFNCYMPLIILHPLTVIDYEQDQQEGNYAFGIVEGGLDILAHALLLIGIWKVNCLFFFQILVYFLFRTTIILFS